MKGDNMHYLICGFSGIGKSTAEQKAKNVFDFESSGYSHDFTSPVPIRNTEFPRNYVDAVIKHMEEHHNCVYLLSCHEEVRKELKSRGLDYIIVMPDYDQRNEYTKRWLKRGSSLDFIVSMFNRWDEMITSCEEDDAPKIYLSENEYVFDVLPR